jgi:hypothetical protein
LVCITCCSWIFSFHVNIYGIYGYWWVVKHVKTHPNILFYDMSSCGFWDKKTQKRLQVFHIWLEPAEPGSSLMSLASWETSSGSVPSWCAAKYFLTTLEFTSEILNTYNITPLCTPAFSKVIQTINRTSMNYINQNKWRNQLVCQHSKAGAEFLNLAALRVFCLASF